MQVICQSANQFTPSVVSDSLRPHGIQHARLPVHNQLLQPTQTHVHNVSDAIQPSHPLSSPSPPAFSLSQHQVFSNESVLRIRWPKYWSFSFNISPSNEYSGLISFRMDWLDLLNDSAKKRYRELCGPSWLQKCMLSQREISYGDIFTVLSSVLRIVPNT